MRSPPRGPRRDSVTPTTGASTTCPTPAAATAPAARATVSGLAIGTYFWRVQAVSNDVGQGPWSAVRSFRVTGAGAGVPAAPTLNEPRGGNSFHPWELFGMSWNAVPGA